MSACKDSVAAAPGLEALERRQLLAAVVEPNGVLLIAGTAKNDRIVVWRDDAGALLRLRVNDVDQTFSATDFDKIVIDSRRGDDVVQVLPADDGAAITHPLTVWCHAGDDLILGGPGPEKLFPGDGNDTVNGGDGRDSIYGGPGPGNDFLRGGGGSDLIDGMDGSDTLLGDAGNDHLYGGANPDRLRGGTGNDDLYGGGGRDHLAGEAGDDTLFGDNGDDVIDGGAGENVTPDDG